MSWFNTLSLHTFSFFKMLFSLLKHYLELYITDTALKVSRSLYFFTTSLSHGALSPGFGVWASLMLFSLCELFSDQSGSFTYISLIKIVQEFFQFTGLDYATSLYCKSVCCKH